MKLSAKDLWRFDGTLDRGSYALWGCGLAAFKVNFDRLVAWVFFGRFWTIFDYWHVSSARGTVLSVSWNDAVFYATMVALALPFIYVGVALTVRRLRTVGLPVAAVALFFVPVINLLFFLTLCVLPDPPQELASVTDPQERRRRLFRAVIPESQLGSAALGMVVTTAAGVGLTVLAVLALREYGWGLFCGLPFAQGLIAVLIYGYHRPRPYGACVAVACLSVTLLALGLLACAVEGVVCLIMAAPIGLVMAALGGTVGYFIQNAPQGGKAGPQVVAVLLLFLPVVMGAESMDPEKPPLYAVTTTVEVDATPERVWPNVVSFSELPPPSEWIFRTGIAYPIRARIAGQGVGAIRRCEFTTGPFVEPITAWEPSRRLAFNVVAQPKCMNELSPYGAISAPHIDNFLVSERGEFLLVPLPGGRTRLEGTTWYRHKIWPSVYWRVWSDAILHRIHLRVLAHVRHLSETPTGPQQVGRQ